MGVGLIVFEMMFFNLQVWESDKFCLWMVYIDEFGICIV